MGCPACGYQNIERGEHRCPHCGRRLDRAAPTLFTEPPAAPTPGATPPPPPIPTSLASGAATALAPEWKHEVAERLEQFRNKRARQQGLFSDAPVEKSPELQDQSDEVPQPDLGRKVVAFEDFAAARIEPLIVERPEPAAPPPRRPPAPRWVPPLESRRPSPEEARHAAEPAVGPAPATGALGPAPAVEEGPSLREIVCPNPVAPLLLRGLAAALDLSVAGIAMGVFLGTFHLLGGALHFDHKAGGATALAVASLAAFYFFLYTCYGGETPGLQWMGLCVLDYEGRSPQAPQRFVRAVGLLLSAAALGLGYLWALADEESLTWHDRMSKTFITRDLAAPRHLLAPGA